MIQLKNLCTLFLLFSLPISSVSNASLASPTCETSISETCLLDTALHFIEESQNKYQHNTLLRYIAISGALNKSIPLEVYELLPKKDIPISEGFFYAGKALFFGINDNRDLWETFINKSLYVLPKQWASSFYARHLAINTKTKDPFIEELFSNGLEGYTPLIEARTYYSLNTGNDILFRTVVEDIIEGENSVTDKLQQLFSVISVSIISKNMGEAESVYARAEQLYSSNVFWDSFSASVSALHSTNSFSNHSAFISMVEDTRFKAVVYSAMIDINISNNNSEGLQSIRNEMLSYLRSTSEVFNSNTTALLALKILSLMYIV
jgi:hypothetical protein